MVNKRWEFTGETKIHSGIILRRIRATVEFKLRCDIVIRKGEVGGWIEKESNLCGNAFVSGDALVSGNAEVSGDALVSGSADVSGNARVSGDAWVYGDAEVKSSKDYCVYKNTWSSFRWFTYTRSNKMWKVGCFYGTGTELIAKAYKDGEKSGKCYEAIVKAQEAIENVMEE